MKVKMFSAYSGKTLERKINEFIIGQEITVSQIQFQASFGTVYAMVTYKENIQKSFTDGFKNI